MPLDVRAAAARVLGNTLAGQSLNQSLPPLLEKVGARDRALLRQLCYGSLRDAPRLLACMDRLLDKPLRDKDKDIRGLLLCGLHQLDGMRVPDHAAVAATVGATRALKKPWARGLTNALLRRYLREREELWQALDQAAALSHPAWLYKSLQEQWPDAAADIIDANNQQPPMTLRVNSQLDRDDCLAALAAQGIEALPGALSPQAITLVQPRDVTELPGFTSGELSVQDEAAQMAALLLQAGPGERILDACAAPGGKACHILELQPQLAELVAMDIDEQRLARVAENLDRLKLEATLLAGDAAAPPGNLQPDSFDRILVDAPCSATGVIRRHPDVKVLRRETDIEGFARQQLDILAGLWPLLKPGGTLLYATCSVLQQENSQLVARFVQEQPDASPAPTQGEWGVETDLGRQILPSPQGPDGLFYAALHKTG